MIHRIRSRAHVAALVAVVLAVAVAPAGGQTKEPVRVGFVYGIGSVFSEQVKNGLDVAVKEVNDAGGVLGRPLRLVTYDDQNKPEEAAAAFERLVSRDKVDVLIGSILTATAMAQKEVTRKYKRLHIAVSTKADIVRTEGHPLLFALNSTISQDGKLFHEYVAKQLRPKTVALLVVNNDYGLGAAAAATRDWSGPGSPRIVAIEQHDHNAPDLSAQLTKLKALNPDAVYLAQDSVEVFAKAAIQVDELGIKARKLAFPGNLSADFIKLAGKSSEGIISGDLYINTLANPDNQAFVKAFQAQKGAPPQKMELVGYDAVSVLAQAIAKAGTVDNEAVAKALREQAFRSPRGQLRFEAAGKAYQASGNFVLTTVKDGKVVQYQR